MMFSKAIREGDEYNAITKVITINILDFDYIELPAFHTTFHMREDKYNHYVLTDTMEIHNIEMPKFRKFKDKDYSNPLHRWLLFFDDKTPMPILKELIDMDAAIQKSNDYLDTLSGDLETVRLYQVREMALFDYKSSIAKAKKEGKIEGKIEVARNFLDILSVEDIAERTNLSISDVQKLKDERNI